jgi:hypothetical protein
MNNNTSNVTPITAVQAQASAKFTITAVLDGFPIQIEVEGAADKLRAMIDLLIAIGAEPPVVANSPSRKDSSAPTCSIHHTPLKKAGVASSARRKSATATVRKPLNTPHPAERRIYSNATGGAPRPASLHRSFQ